MAEENKFFRYVWRVNAIVLAGAGIAVAFAVAFSLLNRWRPEEAEPAGHFAPVPQHAEKAFTYRLQKNGDRRHVGQEEIVALGRWQGSPDTYALGHVVSESYNAQSEVVNLLAVDQTTADSHWLFRGYERAIIADQTLYDEISLRPDARSSPVALAMLVIDSDTNKDGELNEKDRQSIYIYRPGGAQAARLVTADLIVSYKQTSNDHYLVIYENGSSAVAASYALPEFKLIAEKPLPKVPNG